MSNSYIYVSFPNMKYLLSGMAINVRRCADVLDGVLTAFNNKTGIPDQIVAWNAKGGNATGPLSFPDHGRFIIELTQSLQSDGQMLWTAVLLEHEEKEKAPLVFIRLHSPSLDIPMRLEIPMRALIKGGPSLEGTYCVYLHALLVEGGTEFVYYGITKRGWNLRFAEHTRAAVAEKSRRLLPRTLNELIEARAAQISGKLDDRPKLAGIVSSLPAVGLTKDSAMDVEEYLVDKYSLSSKHPRGLNMIPGGRAGIAALHLVSAETANDAVETEEREGTLDSYLKSHPQLGIPNPGVAEKWNDPIYAEAVICGRENRLSADQVRRIRYLAAVGATADQIKEEVGAIDEGQIQRVLAGRTYSRIR